MPWQFILMKSKEKKMNNRFSYSFVLLKSCICLFRCFYCFSFCEWTTKMVWFEQLNRLIIFTLLCLWLCVSVCLFVCLSACLNLYVSLNSPNRVFLKNDFSHLFSAIYNHAFQSISHIDQMFKSDYIKRPSVHIAFIYDDSQISNQTKNPFFHVGNVSLFIFQDAWKKLTDIHLFNAKHQPGQNYRNSNRITLY